MTKHQQKLNLLKQLHNSARGFINPYSLLQASFLTQKELQDNLTHQQAVFWSYKCAKSVQELNKNKETKAAAESCLSLVKQWLQDNNSVSKEQLNKAANAAANAARAAKAAAYAADAACAYAAADAACAYAAPNKQAQESLNLQFLIEVVIAK